MSNDSYDVFICYRPESGAEARLIRDALLKRGFRVLEDVSYDAPPDSGEVPLDPILKLVEAASCFVVIFSPLALGRLQDTDDRLGREIAHAVETERRIIPIFLEGSTFPPYVPAAVEPLKRCQGLKYSHLEFESMIEEIAARIPVEAETRATSKPDQTNAEPPSTGFFRRPQPVSAPPGGSPKPRPKRDPAYGRLNRNRPPKVAIDYESESSGMEDAGQAVEQAAEEERGVTPEPSTESAPGPERTGAQAAGANLQDTPEQLNHTLEETASVPSFSLPPSPGAPPRPGSPIGVSSPSPGPPGTVWTGDKTPVRLPWLGPSARIGRFLRIAERRLVAFLGRGIRGARADPVDCTVFSPPAVAVGDSFLVQVFAHRPEQAETAKNLAKEFDESSERRGFRSLETKIRRGSTLRFHLAMARVTIDDEVQQITWRGEPESVQFSVTIPPGPSGFAPGNVIGTVTVDQDSVPLGYIKFKLTIVPPAQAVAPSVPVAVGEVARLYRKAFISYASPDRNEVLKRVQMLEELRIGFFQDVLSLEPGERWQKALYRHIDESDLFLLFWSTAAKQSKWVMEEVHYALKRKGDDDLAPPEILPVIIEGPPPVPPPVELESLHFNDRLVYFMVPGNRR